MDESSITQNRRNRRSNVLMAATVEVSGTVRPVKMRNLSAEGVLIEGEHLPVEGSEILLRKGDLSVAGRIVWLRGGRAGVAFAELLPAEQLLRHVPTPRPRVAPVFRRPGFGNTPLSPGERKLGEDWIFGKPIPPVGD